MMNFSHQANHGWAGASYIPDKEIKKKTDNTIEIISNTGTSIKKINNIIKQKNESLGEQSTNLVKYIYELAEKEKYETKQLWLDPIPENIYISDLKKKYKVDENTKDEKGRMDIILGEYDDPSNQKQDLVKFNLLGKDNMIIYGNAESGKETLLSTLIYDTITTYNSEQVQMYLMDFGSEALKIFKKSAHMGDTIFLGEDDKLSKFFDMVKQEIKERKNILSNYNGDYDNYIETGKKMPLWIIMVNNYESFDENYNEKYEDVVLTLTREGLSCGIMFIFTVSSANSLRYRLAQNFNSKIVLQLNKEDDYYAIFDSIGKMKPSHIFGRGLIIGEDNNIHEFQTAKICNNVDYNTFVQETIQEVNKNNSVKAKPIPVVPEVLELSDIKDYLKDINKIPIGMDKQDLSIVTYDFVENFMTVIVAKDMKNAIEYTSFIRKEIEQFKNIKIKVLDPEKIRKDKNKSIKEVFDEILKEAENDDETNDNFTLYVAIGIEKFITDESIDIEQLNEDLAIIKESKKCSFILIDNANRLAQHTFDEWYMNNIEENTGIWVGNGIQEQTLLSLDINSSNIDNKCGKTWGYLVKDGNSTAVKLVGMQETEDYSE